MPWLAPALSVTGKLVSKTANQLLVGRLVNADALFGECNGEVGGVGLQVAASILGGSIDLTLSGMDDAALVFVGSGMNASFFCFGVAVSLGTHLGYFGIEAGEAGFDVAEAAIGVGTGTLRFV